MRLFKGFVVLTISVLTAACSEGPVTPAATATPRLAVTLNEKDLPFLGTLFVCTENVDFAGTFHVKTSSTTAASGNVSGTVHINAKGTGVGQTSGATYNWNDNINQSFMSAAPLPLVLSLSQTWKLIGKGPASNAIVKARGHLTVNANGDVTSAFNSFTIECK